jgi:seryl-tRNA synthetase
MGSPATVRAWQSRWRDRSLELLRGLGLEAEADVGADPFFGRGGKMLADSQREQQLKFEILAPIEGPTALASFNYHQEHFSATYGIELEGGGVAHTACLGFGHERVVLALLRRHGLDVGAWPGEVRSELGL